MRTCCNRMLATLVMLVTLPFSGRGRSWRGWRVHAADADLPQVSLMEDGLRKWLLNEGNITIPPLLWQTLPPVATCSFTRRTANSREQSGGTGTSVDAQVNVPCVAAHREAAQHRFPIDAHVASPVSFREHYACRSEESAPQRTDASSGATRRPDGDCSKL